MKKIMCGMSCWPWDAAGFIYGRYGRFGRSEFFLKNHLTKTSVSFEMASL